MGNSEYDLLLDLISEVRQETAGVFQSGFATVHDASIKQIRNLSDVSERYGLHTLSQMLSSLAELIEARRHTTSFDDSKLMDVMCKICKYTEICERRIRYENILQNYTLKNHENTEN